MRRVLLIFPNHQARRDAGFMSRFQHPADPDLWGTTIDMLPGALQGSEFSHVIAGCRLDADVEHHLRARLRLGPQLLVTLV